MLKMSSENGYSTLSNLDLYKTYETYCLYDSVLPFFSIAVNSFFSSVLKFYNLALDLLFILEFRIISSNKCIFFRTVLVPTVIDIYFTEVAIPDTVVRVLTITYLSDLNKPYIPFWLPNNPIFISKFCQKNKGFSTK